jgi:hypothetical protein
MTLAPILARMEELEAIGRRRALREAEALERDDLPAILHGARAAQRLIQEPS